MSNELALLKQLGIAPASTDTLNALAEISKGDSFLKRIQLIGKGKYVDTGKIPPGRWGVPMSGGEEIIDLGASIDVIPLRGRPKAMDVADRDAIITVYDPADPEFVRIRNAPKDSGCMWGPTYLVIERQTGEFYELFFGNASGRTEAAKLQAFLPGPEGIGVATLSIRYKKGPKHSWHVPVITKCTMPFSELPSPEDIAKQIERFESLSSGVEKVQEDEATTKASKRAR